MLGELRERVVAYLDGGCVCILSVACPDGARAMPVLYRSDGLEIECLLPRWSDVAYGVQQDPRVMLVVLAAVKGDEPDWALFGQRWMQCKGTVRPVERPDWTVWPRETRYAVSPDALYMVVRVTPHRIDLMESQGWGVRETLDL